MALVRTSAPAAEPLGVSEVKAHLRADLSEDDPLIVGLIQAAREWAEGYLQRSLITQTWQLSRDYLTPVIHLPQGPVQSVSSFEYVDDQGVTQTLASTEYRVDTDSDPARITRAWGKSWPSIRYVTNAVQITFVAGYGDSASDVPRPIRHGMLMAIGHWYENREQVVVGVTTQEVPMAVEALLGPYRAYL